MLLPETLCSTPGLLHCPLPMLGSKGDTGEHVSMATCKMAYVYCNLRSVHKRMISVLSRCTFIVWKSVNLHLNTVRRSEINTVYVSVVCHSSSAEILQSANRRVCICAAKLVQYNKLICTQILPSLCAVKVKSTEKWKMMAKMK